MNIYISKVLALVLFLTSALCESTIELTSGNNIYSVEFKPPTADTTQGLRVDLKLTLDNIWGSNKYVAAACAPHDDGTVVSGSSNNGFLMWFGCFNPGVGCKDNATTSELRFLVQESKLL